MRVLGLDVGVKRIGVALSDETGMVASPLTVYERKGMQADAQQIVQMASQNECVAIVFGLPLELNGKEGLRARRVLLLRDAVAALFGGELPLVDERFTTKEAERALIGADVRRDKRKQVVDKVAAALILQSYLESQS
ncbi:Holliday junction resolvase RuvX [Myxococcota bacterium]|nr:Holliday junction resolvase RuvX [Myxococcota bacterium]MBU1533690.1 Holliday junction resolvase RuvX [Myxococcota bacterium]